MDSKDFTYRAEALLLKVTLAVLRLPGLDRASAIGGWLGRTFGPKLGITRRARRRIARVMPELGEAETVKAVWRPLTTTQVDEEKAAALMKLVQALEDDDDVQAVYSNFEVSDEVMEKIG